MDTVGPLPVAATQNKFMLVAIFQQGQWRLQVFLEEHRMPVRSPQAIVANNGPQFDNIAFRTFCTELNIKNLYSTPYYPQSNGQAETTNKTLLTALKKRLEWVKGKWVDELLEALWTYQTTFRQPTRATLFNLAYRMEVVIPTDIGMSITKTTMQGQRNDNEELERQLDWVDEVWGNTAIRMASYHQRAIAHYNKMAWPCVCWTGTLVLRKVFENTAEAETRKFQTNWEGPYVVAKAGDSRAYHLQTLDGVSLLCPWNVSNLKQYYQ